MSDHALGTLEGGQRWLAVVAAPLEARAVARGTAQRGSESSLDVQWRILELSDRLDLVVSGVGKASAAGATARTLNPARHGGVVSLGIAGALPGSGLGLGSAVLASTSVFADEGVGLESGFQDLAALGFAPLSGGSPKGMGIECSSGLVAPLEALVDRTGPIACVSTCSGTDALAQAITHRTGAVAEAMEGAAVGLAARRAGGPDLLFAELRVISNTTGHRQDQDWDMRGALERLSELSALL